MHSAHPRRGRAPVTVATGALALALCALGAMPAHAAPTAVGIELIATPTALDAGDSLDVAVALEGADDVFAYELELTYDPALLQYVDGSATGPDGGFDTVGTATGSVTLLHTRLGGSPGLSGDVDATLQFLALDGGDATVSLSSVTLVGADAVSASESDVAEASVVITAPPVVAPSPSPSASSSAPVPSTSPSASAAPAGDGSSTGSLSSTGADAAPMLVVAAAAIAAGLLALGATALRRRKAVQR